MSNSISELEAKVKQLETKLEQFTQAYNQELIQFKTTFFQQSNRFEALLRYLVTGNTLTMEQFLFALDEYQRFRNKLVSSLKEKPSVVDRVNDASVYNETAYFKLYADDIDILGQIEAAGGTAPHTAELILNSLPSTDRLKLYLKRYLVQTPPEPEPGPDGIVVSTDKKEN